MNSYILALKIKVMEKDNLHLEFIKDLQKVLKKHNAIIYQGYDDLGWDRVSVDFNKDDKEKYSKINFNYISKDDKSIEE